MEKLEPVAIIDATDKEAWHRERALGVTKTDMKRLISGTRAAFREVWEAKNGGKRFTGNEFTRLGLEYEPSVAVWVEANLGVPASQVLYARGDNPRHRATPDCYMWDEGEGALVEIKTTHQDWSGGLPPQIVRDVLWQKYVLGAGYAAVAVLRMGKGAPLTLEPQIIEVPDDPEETARLIAAADAYTAWVDAGRPDEDAEPVPVRYRDLIERVVAARAEEAAALAELREWAAGQPNADRDGFKAETSVGSVALVPVKGSVFDKEKAKAEEPDLVAAWERAQKAYRKENVSSRFTVAAPKREEVTV